LDLGKLPKLASKLVIIMVSVEYSRYFATGAGGAYWCVREFA